MSLDLHALLGDDADSLLIVGVNLGDPWFPFDIDDEVFTPHGWIVKLAPQ